MSFGNNKSTKLFTASNKTPKNFDFDTFSTSLEWQFGQKTNSSVPVNNNPGNTSLTLSTSSCRTFSFIPPAKTELLPGYNEVKCSSYKKQRKPSVSN